MQSNLLQIILGLFLCILGELVMFVACELTLMNQKYFDSHKQSVRGVF